MITRAEGERKECFEAILRKCKENEEKRGDAYFVFIFGEIGSTINLTKLLHIGCTKKKNESHTKPPSNGTTLLMMMKKILFKAGALDCHPTYSGAGRRQCRSPPCSLR